MPNSTLPTVEPAPDAPPTMQSKIVGGVGNILGAILKTALGVILANEPLRLKIADFAGTLIGSFAIKVGDHVVSKLIDRRTEWAVQDPKLQAEMPDSGDIRLPNV